jgi:S-adenosyl-L-methionine hydrolase (adenosine-forming)
MALRYDTISFLSDYGHTDEFVGVVHSVIRQLCPEVTVVDVTHEVAPFDVRAGGLTLARSVQYLCPGVVMAVVDPGVGSTRRPIAVEVADGRAVLIGPDNGVLAPAVAMLGGATRAVWLNDAMHHLDAPGPLFDGRDVFAPVAAKLCSGEVAFEELGELIEPAGLIPGVFPISESTEDGLSAEVLWIDRYGNVQLNVEPEELDAMGEVFELRMERGSRSARRVHHFSELGTGSVGLVVDSYGFIAVVADRASAARELGLTTSDPLTLVALTEGVEPGTTAVTTPVELSSQPGRDRA